MQRDEHLHLGQLARVSSRNFLHPHRRKLRLQLGKLLKKVRLSPVTAQISPP